MKRLLSTCCTAVVLLLTACGGGSSSGSAEDNSTDNTPPEAVASTSAMATEGDTITLDGSLSVDDDGVITAYRWEQRLGTTVSLNNAQQSIATLTAPELSLSETLVFELTVVDDAGAENSVELSINVSPSEERVFTTEGVVEGETLDGDIRLFRGVPFAAPPIGDLRWRAPEAPIAYHTVLPTKAFAPACIQADEELAGGFNPADNASEDCLYLNIWTPEASDAAPKPVMVWIHGGGNVQGGASQPAYDGQFLARDHNVVVVSIQYRLGVFGYLAHPKLSVESESLSSGNYGLLDIIAALEWLQNNIAQFGGDPQQVTLFGESAGAVNTCAMLVSPLASGLFHGAIMQSGFCAPQMMDLTTTQLPKFDSAENIGLAASVALGCDNQVDELACLRSLDANLIHDTLSPDNLFFSESSGERYGVITDAYVLPAPPFIRIERGEFNRVPVMLGSTENEAGFWISGINSSITSVNAYELALEYLFDGDSDLLLNGPAVDVLSAYPASTRQEARSMFQRLFTHATFTCPSRRAARALTSQGVDVWRYEFTRLTPGVEFLGAFHASEIPYVFGSLDRDGPADEFIVSEYMMAYWANFAKYANPNASHLLDWPLYDLNDDEHLHINLPLAVGSELLKEQCDLLDTIPF